MSLFRKTSGRNQERFLGLDYDWVNNPGVVKNTYTYVPETWSGGMPLSINHNRDKDGKFSSGGPWIQWQTQVFRRPGSPIKVYRPSWSLAYDGRLFPPTHVQNPLPRSGWNTTGGLQTAYDQLGSRGAEAWNLLRPDKPDFSLASSLYELREAPRMFKDAVLGVRNACYEYAGRKVKSTKRSSMSKAAEWHLAAQFGWLPLLGDIRKFIQAQQKGQNSLARLIRNANRPTRRRGRLRNSSDGTEAVVTFNYGTTSNTSLTPGFVTQCYWFPAEKSTRHGYKIETWAEGRFRYLLPPGPQDVVWKRRMLRRLLGGRITPSSLYAIMPWSWLIDYFTNLGSFVEAVSPGVADRLVADYAYLMQRETWYSYTFARQGYKGDVGGKTRVNADGSLETRHTIQLRVVASPFGFGFKQGDLSAHQIGILGALGLSRLP